MSIWVWQSSHLILLRRRCFLHGYYLKSQENTIRACLWLQIVSSRNQRLDMTLRTSLTDIQKATSLVYKQETRREKTTQDNWSNIKICSRPINNSFIQWSVIKETQQDQSTPQWLWFSFEKARIWGKLLSWQKPVSNKSVSSVLKSKNSQDRVTHPAGSLKNSSLCTASAVTPPNDGKA